MLTASPFGVPQQVLRSILDSGEELGMPDGVLINGKGQFNRTVPDGIQYETVNVNVDPGSHRIFGIGRSEERIVVVWKRR